MDQQPIGNDPTATTGDEISSPARRRRRPAAIALVTAGVVAGAALSLTTGAFASGGLSQLGGVPTVSGTPSASPSADPNEKADPNGRHGRGHGDGHGPKGRGDRGFGQLSRALHGTATVPKQGGGYQEIAVQRGTVTSVSVTSLVVTSQDGFVGTYVIDATTLVNAARDGITTVKVRTRSR